MSVFLFFIPDGLLSMVYLLPGVSWNNVVLSAQAWVPTLTAIDGWGYVAITVATSLSALGFKKLGETSRFQLFGSMVTRVKTTEKIIALTYDDGPSPPYTEKLLAVLDRFQVKATFFVIGQAVEAHRETAQRIQAQGHELGNHSYSHRPLLMTPRRVIAQEIGKTDALLQQLGVTKPIHFRAPYGYKRIRLPLMLAQLRKTNVLWNLDPRDHEANESHTIVNHVMEHVRPGSIVLLHDGGGDRSKTIEATAQLIPQLQAQGYRFTTVSELLARQP